MSCDLWFTPHFWKHLLGPAIASFKRQDLNSEELHCTCHLPETLRSTEYKRESEIVATYCGAPRYSLDHQCSWEKSRVERNLAELSWSPAASKNISFSSAASKSQNSLRAAACWRAMGAPSNGIHWRAERKKVEGNRIGECIALQVSLFPPGSTLRQDHRQSSQLKHHYHHYQSLQRCLNN